MSKEKFLKEIGEGYKFEGDSILLGGAMYNSVCQKESFIRLPLRTLNRHGLIAGATGTGKTKTLQILAEQLSARGVPSLIMDIKGDLSGIAKESKGHKKIEKRHEMIGYPFLSGNSPVEFLTLSEEPGVRLRSTISEFGPILLAKILDLTDVQEGILSVLFKYCDDRELPLLDMKDLKKLLNYCVGAGKSEIESEYGKMSTTSVGSILRKLVALEQQNGDVFFGEPSFDVNDLVRIDENGCGIVSILRLTDIQNKPKLFSTFMLQLLAEIYTIFPEEGDLDKPKFCLFIDEAHLVFKNASDALLSQIEIIIKLIRSKGVGIFFITQNPVDIPDAVLGQLGMKIQHALRAFTARDRKAIKLAVQNYPDSSHYNVEKIITTLGIGEALFTALNEDGIPTPLAQVMLRAPQSRMEVLSENEINDILFKSELINKYNEEVDRESAYEILSAKIEEFKSEPHQNKRRSQRRREKSTFEKVLNSTTTRQIGRTIARELTRGLLGAMGINTRRRRRRNNFPW
ncbi:MAG: helicase HerA-like domain-containing protein [Saprospiraceae bacterium]